MIATLGVAAMAAVSGCTSGPDRGQGPPHRPPPFQHSELRSVPDPLTMLTTSLRNDLRLDQDRHRSTCENGGFRAREAVTRWDCTLRPPQQGRVTFPKGEANPTYRSGEIRVGLEEHHPTADKPATTRATAVFAELKEIMFSSGSRALRLGDEGFMTPTTKKPGSDNLVLIRVRNVVFNVATRPYPVRRRLTSADMDRLMVRTATELARSLTELRN